MYVKPESSPELDEDRVTNNLHRVHRGAATSPRDDARPFQVDPGQSQDTHLLYLVAEVLAKAEAAEDTVGFARLAQADGTPES